MTPELWEKYFLYLRLFMLTESMAWPIMNTSNEELSKMEFVYTFTVERRTSAWDKSTFWYAEIMQDGKMVGAITSRKSNDDCVAQAERMIVMSKAGKSAKEILLWDVKTTEAKNGKSK